jgi:hypothetical protein
MDDDAQSVKIGEIPLDAVCLTAVRDIVVRGRQRAWPAAGGDLAQSAVVKFLPG